MSVAESWAKHLTLGASPPTCEQRTALLPAGRRVSISSACEGQALTQMPQPVQSTPSISTRRSKLTASCGQTSKQAVQEPTPSVTLRQREVVFRGATSSAFSARPSRSASPATCYLTSSRQKPYSSTSFSLSLLW